MEEATPLLRIPYFIRVTESVAHIHVHLLSWLKIVYELEFLISGHFIKLLSQLFM